MQYSMPFLHETKVDICITLFLKLMIERRCFHPSLIKMQKIILLNNLHFVHLFLKHHCVFSLCDYIMIHSVCYTNHSTCTQYYSNCWMLCWIFLRYLHVIVEIQQLLNFLYHPAQNVSEKLYHRVPEPHFSWCKFHNLLNPVLNYSTTFSVGLCTASGTKIQQLFL